MSLLEAYDENLKPITQNGESLEGKKVILGSLKTKADAALEAYGIKSEPEIRLVEKGVKTTNSPHGEQYEEVKDGRPMQVAASRVKITIPEIGQSWGVLVSKIDLVAQDQEEVNKLKVAQWRVADSIRTIRDSRASSQEAVSVDDGRVENIQFGDEDEMSFVVYSGSEDNPVRTEYYFSVKHGSHRKDYAKAGNDWVAVIMPNQELDGTVPYNPVSAARTIDNFRYQITHQQKD